LPISNRTHKPISSPSVTPRKRAVAAQAPSLAPAFQAAYQRELATRSDGASAEACLWAAAHASRELLAERWARTQAQDRASLMCCRQRQGNDQQQGGDAETDLYYQHGQQ